jgi:hypothetical protein
LEDSADVVSFHIDPALRKQRRVDGDSEFWGEDQFEVEVAEELKTLD